MQLCAICLLLLTGYLVWSVVIDGDYYHPPVTYHDGCFTAMQPVFAPGDSLILRVVATKSRTIPGIVTWSLVNAETHEVVANFLPRSTVIGPGLNDYRVNVFTIPEKTPPGTYYARGMATYAVNPLRAITYPLKSDNFRIGVNE